MPGARTVVLLTVLLLPASLAAQPSKGDATAGVPAAMGTGPLRFEPNRGQTDPSVRFIARGKNYRLFLTADEAVVTIGDVTLRQRLVGARTARSISGISLLAAQSHYLKGRDPRKWIGAVPTFAKVRYEAVYPGIDQIYYGTGEDLEYDFVVAPGADPAAIRLQFAGVDRTRVGPDGDLLLSVRGREIRQRRPVAFQLAPTGRREVAVKHVVRARGEIGFEVAEYDRSRPLTIDPVLVYSTYWGGTLATHVTATAADSSGSAYMVGITEDLDFPVTPDALQPTHGGISPSQCADACDAFLTKFDAAGGVLYSTYLGGEGYDAINAIALDRFGGAYLAGQTTAPDFPTTAGAFTTTCRMDDGVRCNAGFVARLDPSGASLTFSTFLQASIAFSTIAPVDIALDAASNVFLTGLTNDGLPVTPGVLKPQRGWPGAFAPFTGFAMKMNSSGSALIYATYLGGTLGDHPAAIAVDGFGHAYVAGIARSPDFPTTPGAIKRTCRTFFSITDRLCWVAFIMKINPTATAMVYSTMLGGDGDGIAAVNGVSSDATDIAVDRDGLVYVTGSTFTTDFPTTPGSLKPATTTRDAYVAKLNRSGTGLIYSTYLGGDAGDSSIGGGFDHGGGIAIDETGSAYVSGRAASNDFPMVGPVQSTIGSASVADAYVARLNPSGTALTFSTYLGGADEDFAKTISRAGDDVYVAGATRSSDFPLVNAANPVPGRLTKSFLAKIAVPPSCGSDETPNLAIVDTGFLPTILWPLTLQVVALRNNSAGPIAGPLTFVMDDLQNAVFVGSSQITRCLSPQGDPVTLVTVGSDNSMTPNETAIFPLWFVQTRLLPISYTPRVLGATGTR